ncbi:MAG: methyltransferase domain-containing protein [Saprospiraceae bacterium]|nr:methyltransferase domain-containing protein [Saprospiraceae bacterium]
MKILDIGAGGASKADVQVDQVKFPDTTHVFDIVNTPWEFEDEEFDEVRMEQVLEHIPSVVYYKEDGKFKHIYPRVLIMKEIHRVLKKNGIAHISVPEEMEQMCQDPTHTDTMITDGFFNYFCGQWGGNEKGSFAYEAYGINFKFEKVESYRTGFIRTVRLKKP